MNELPTCTRRLQWCMGHRLMGHESKCSHLHGHNYVGFFTARPKAKLDTVGRVVDFGELKAKIGTWIEHNWDHGFVLNEHDKRGLHALTAFDTAYDGHTPIENKLFLMAENPTAENLASLLLHKICPRLFKKSSFEVNEIILWETENCYATVKLED